MEPDNQIRNRRARGEFKSPSVFHGRDEDDAATWIERYEALGRFNYWTDADRRDNLVVFLEGAARKWFACLEAANLVPDRWSSEDEPEGENKRDNNAGEPGLKELFLEQFTPYDYQEHYETRLRNRRQRADKSLSEYHFDVLNMCRLVNRNMAERTKIDYLLRGLKPDLMEKMWMTKSQTSAEFLREGKRLQELALR